MPVLFRGRSEYARNYKWNESFRSASFVPRTNQTAEDAGLRSDQLGAFQEPRIAGKKKAWHRDPQVQSCLIWWPDSDSENQAKLERRKADTCQQQSPVVAAEKKRKASHRESSTRKQSKEECKSDKMNIPIQKNSEKPDMHYKETVQGMPKKKIQRENLDGSYKKAFPQKSKDRNVLSITSKGDNKQANPKTKQTTPSKRSKKESKHEQNREDKQRVPSQSSENIVLRHKAGLHENKPPRVSRARLSEYQQKFAPPKLVQKSSPMISAADIVHSSSPAIPPHSGVKFRPTTEYVASFKQKELPLTVKSPSKTLSSPVSPSMKPKVRDLQNPYFSNIRKKNIQSEYASQFEANEEFQIGELRKMAESNKQKHIGTHIDPHHLTQIASPFNSCWEASSHGSIDEVDQGKTESRKNDEGIIEKDEEKWSQASQVGSSTSATLETEKETVIDTDSLEDDDTIAGKESVSRKLAWTEENGKDSSEISPDAESCLEGRVTTPRLQDIGGARRTHLDLTTPAKGGALLISPSAPESMVSSVCSEPVRTRQSPIAGTPTHDAQDLIKNRSHTLIQAGRSQKPITYTIDKRQNQSKTKKPLVVRESPQSTTLKTPTPSAMKNTRAPIRGALRSEEFQHCGPTGNLHTAPTNLAYDADALSVASSLTSARASELLNRAQQRKRFWATAP